MIDVVESLVASRVTTQIQYAFASPALFDCVVAYLEVEIDGGGPLRDLLPPEWASIRLAIKGEWQQGEDLDNLQPLADHAPLYGMTSRAHWVDGGPGRAFCIGFYPVGWSSLFKQSAAAYADRIVPLAELLGDDAQVLLAQARECKDFAERVQMANRYFEVLRARNANERRTAHLAKVRSALSDPDCDTVEDMAARAGLSQPQLVRLTKAAYGFPPKFLMRRERFLRMLHRMEARPYSEWRDFIDTQYVDQSHLIRDFKEFMGLSPSRYLALDRPFLNAAMDALRKMGVPVGADPLG